MNTIATPYIEDQLAMIRAEENCDIDFDPDEQPQLTDDDREEIEDGIVALNNRDLSCKLHRQKEMRTEAYALGKKWARRSMDLVDFETFSAALNFRPNIFDIIATTSGTVAGEIFHRMVRPYEARNSLTFWNQEIEIPIYQYTGCFVQRFAEGVIDTWENIREHV